MKVALITTDNREFFRKYDLTAPWMSPPIAALLEGFQSPELSSDLQVHVVSCTRQPMCSPEKLGPNIFFHSLHVPKIGWMRTLYQGCIRAVRKKLREIQPNLVHGQGTEMDCAMEAVFSGLPNVVTIHGNMAELARLTPPRIGSFPWLAARLENFALKRTAGVFCNSDYTERLVKPRTRRTWRVPNALQEQYFSPAANPAHSAKCTLVNIGLVSPRKRQLEMLDVATNLSREGLQFELVFVGQANPNNPYAVEFLKRIEPLERAGCARYVGTKALGDLIQLLDASHALVHFPFEEAFGLVVAEALARNLKFFGAQVGGVMDITTDVPGAELFALDDWGGLTAAIGRWIRAGFPRPPGAAQTMRNRYHPTVVARRHLEIYREVLGRGSKP